MGQPTNITVNVDSREYSRYEPGRDTISVSARLTGGGPYTSESLVIELLKARRSRDVAVGVATASVTGTDPQTVSSTFYLPDLVDQDLLNLVRHGKYFVKVTSPETAATVVIGSGTGTPITLTTVETGTTADAWTVSVVTPVGTSPLMATVSGTDLTISLATSSSVLVASENTREKIVALITSTLANSVVASFTGTANLSLSANEGPTNFANARDAVSGESSDFDVRIVSVARLKSEQLFGISLFAGQARFVRNQPTNITGVTISEISNNHPMGMFTLNYISTPTAQQLSWNNGPVVTVSAAGEYLLRKGNGSMVGGSGNCSGSRGLLGSILSNEYIIVKVTGSTFLPVSSTADEILIEQMKIDDVTLGRFIDQATAWLENVELAVYLEPTNIVTDRDPTMIQFAAGINSPTPLYADPDFDFLVGPLTYFPPRTGTDWVEIQTPYMQLLRVDSLFGSIANTRVVDIDLDWINHYTVGGLIQLVPFNQTIAFDYLGLTWVNALRGSAAIPNFWHFNIIAGLRDCPADLQELIAKKAAMDALVALGNALRPGVGSTSLGRDGVSQSVSYNTQMQYGPYTGAIMAFKDWIDKNLVRYRGKYRGPTMVVV